MGMKFACQHLLCRRDLSCTKVNAVNRLRTVWTRGRELQTVARRGGSSWNSCTTPPGASAQPPRWILLEQNWLADQSGQNKWTQLSRLVSVLSK